MRTTSTTAPIDRPELGHGFTLIELVITLLVLGVVAAITFPRVSAADTRMKLSLAQEHIEREIEYTQANARATSQAFVFRFTDSPPGIRIQSMGDGRQISRDIGLAAPPFRLVSIKDRLSTDDLQIDAEGEFTSGGIVQISTGTEVRVFWIGMQSEKLTEVDLERVFGGLPSQVMDSVVSGRPFSTSAPVLSDE